MWGGPDDLRLLASRFILDSSRIHRAVLYMGSAEGTAVLQEIGPTVERHGANSHANAHAEAAPQSNPTAPGTLAKTVQASRASGGDLGNTPLSTAAYPGWGHYFGGIRVHASASKAVQAKLNIN